MIDILYYYLQYFIDNSMFWRFYFYKYQINESAKPTTWAILAKNFCKIGLNLIQHAQPPRTGGAPHSAMCGGSGPPYVKSPAKR